MRSRINFAMQAVEIRACHQCDLSSDGTEFSHITNSGIHEIFVATGLKVNKTCMTNYDLTQSC